LLRATLTTRAHDVAGNNLLSGRTWTFSTNANTTGTGVWQAMSSAGAPAGVEGHTAIWTGSEMVIFGGMAGTEPTDQGARYSPTTDTWTALPGGGPSARERHVAVWTGTEMIVWGGSGPNLTRLNDGARYDPTTNTWTPMSDLGAPSARRDATAVWTGSEMIVWGGLADDHGAYNPTTDTWRTVSNAEAPNPTRRAFHSAIWTGSRMIVWGGETDCNPGPCAVTTRGASYDPASDTWQPLGTSDEPANRLAHSAVWTGTEMIVWGGHTDTSNFFYARGLNIGAAYNPTTNSWREVSTNCGPAGRYGHAAVWTGTDMIVWGGYSMGFNSRTFRNSGALYRPDTDSWQHMASSSAPSSTTLHRAVWDGSRMIVWGRSPALYLP
jgi:N-acetylneuraminic acid mutarotase